MREPLKVPNPPKTPQSWDNQKFYHIPNLDIPEKTSCRLGTMSATNGYGRAANADGRDSKQTAYGLGKLSPSYNACANTYQFMSQVTKCWASWVDVVR
jgi:hypothetical protein